MSRTLWSRSLIASTFFLVATPVSAGVISTENAKAGAGSWTVQSDGTAQGAGVVDVYPAHWSIAPGENVALKVRSTTGFAVRVFRLGWYGGAGATQVGYYPGYGADPQPYPHTDSTYGMAEAGWHTSVTIGTTASWTPGVYIARVEQSGGSQGETFFVVRDDGAKMPVLMVLSTNTHEAYNAWPGMARSGKSLYGFNSSSNAPTAGLSSLTQAVKVSYDRPFLVGGGTADIANQEYPFLRFLERNGWDTGYATDQDIHENPSIMSGRRAVIFVGHSEYWTRASFDAVLAARDRGINFLFATGDTISWQVRYEAGPNGPASTVVGYKESHSKDPEEKAGYSARIKGDYATAAAHYRMVTRSWKTLAYYPDYGIDERRPGMIMTGVQSAGMIRNADGSAADYPYGDLVVTNSTHWIYNGTGVHYGDRIKWIMGYEVDSTLQSSPSFDPFRPSGVVRFGSIHQDSDDKVKGSSAMYRASSGAEVVSFGAIYFSWALDDFAQRSNYGGTTSRDPRAERMINNVLTRWTGTSPMMMESHGKDEGGPDPMVHIDDLLPDEQPVNDPEAASNESQASGGGCTYGGTETGTGGLAALGLTLALVLRRRGKKE